MLFLVVFLFLFMPAISFADPVDDSAPVLPPAETIDGENENEVKDKGGAFERILAAVVEVPIVIVKAVGNLMGLEDIDKLVFRDHIWTEGEAKFIRLWYVTLTAIVMPFFLIAIITTAFKLLSTSINPSARAEAIESIWRWFGALIIITVAPLLVDILMQLVSVFLAGIKGGFELVAGNAGLERSTSDWSGIGFADINIKTGSFLGTAIVKLMFLIIYIYFNVMYIIRKLVISVMVCFTPIMALLWATNKNINAAGIWLGEIASNAFMPVAHALVLCLILGFCDVKNVSNGTWFHILIFMHTLIPLSEVLRNSLQGLLTRMSGLNEAGIAGSSLIAASGLGGLASLGRVGKATFGGNKVDATNMPNMTRGGGSGIGPVDVKPQMPHNPNGAGNTYANSSATGSGGQDRIGIYDQGGSTPQAPDAVGASKVQKVSGTAMKGVDVVGKAYSAALGSVASAVPGGKEVSDAITGGMAGAARGTVMAGRVVGETVGNYKQLKKDGDASLGQAIKQTVGVTEGGIKGAWQAATRTGGVIVSAARDGQSGMNNLNNYQAMSRQEPVGYQKDSEGLS